MFTKHVRVPYMSIPIKWIAKKKKILIIISDLSCSSLLSPKSLLSITLSSSGGWGQAGGVGKEEGVCCSLFQGSWGPAEDGAALLSLPPCAELAVWSQDLSIFRLDLTSYNTYKRLIKRWIQTEKADYLLIVGFPSPPNAVELSIPKPPNTGGLLRGSIYLKQYNVWMCVYKDTWELHNDHMGSQTHHDERGVCGD